MTDHILSDEQLAAFLDGNVSETESVEIISNLDADPIAIEIINMSETIDSDTAFRSSHILPVRALAAANPDNLCSFECETLIMAQCGLDVDNWSLLETAKANNWLRELGTPFHCVGRLLELKGFNVERKYDASVSDIADALTAGRRVIAVIDRNIDSPDPRPGHHAVIITDATPDTVTLLNPTTQTETTVPVADFTRAWKNSGRYFISATLDEMAYNPTPISVEDIALDADLEELTEAIAENAHDIWARARMDEGWTYGPVRDDHAKRHPDLVPYSRLPESEKHYDRIMAMNTLRLVRRLGFDIINLN